MGFFISPGAEQPMTVVRPRSPSRLLPVWEKSSEQYGSTYGSLAPEKGTGSWSLFS